MRDDICLGTEGNRPEYAKVAEATESDDCDFLTLSSAEALERGEGGEAGAQHRCGDGGIEIVGNLEGEIFVRTDMAGVTTLSDGTILVRGAICIDRIGAVVFLVGLAVVTCEVGADLSPDTGAVADL